MRSTNEIIIALKECEPVEYDELRMACLVLNSLLFFSHNNTRRLLNGGIAAEITKKMEFPDAHADLGISKTEYEAMKKDPVKWLGVDNIPGTPEYMERYKISKAIFNKVVNDKTSLSSEKGEKWVLTTNYDKNK